MLKYSCTTHNMEEECALFLFLVLGARFFLHFFKKIIADADCNRLHFEGHSTAPMSLDSVRMSHFLLLPESKPQGSRHARSLLTTVGEQRELLALLVGVWALGYCGLGLCSGCSSLH